MKALDRKLLRDLRLMWSQALTIALVVASGIGGFITTLSAVDSLELARDRFYASGRFADVFAGVKRAPNSLADTLRAAPGVADVQTSIEQIVRIELPGVADGRRLWKVRDVRVIERGLREDRVPDPERARRDRGRSGRFDHGVLPARR